LSQLKRLSLSTSRLELLTLGKYLENKKPLGAFYHQDK